MKFNFKKIAPICAGAILLGSTIGFAGALAADASYPNDFANAIVVVGSAASADMAAANDIAADVGKLTTGTEVTVSSGWLAVKGSTKLYYNGDVESIDNELDSSDMSTLLTDTTYKDNKGNKADYDTEETITFSNGADTIVYNTPSKGDNKDVRGAYLKLLKDTTTPAFNYSIEFPTGVKYDNSTSALLKSDFELTKIKMLGKEWTITDASASSLTSGPTKITMLGGAAPATMNSGESKSFVVNGKSYAVSVVVRTDDVAFTVNGETISLAVGDINELSDGTQIGVTKISTSTKEAVADSVEFYLGADKIVLENGQKVSLGGVDVDQTLVKITNDLANKELDSISIAIAPTEDSWIGVGQSWTDTVFGAVKLVFAGTEQKTEAITFKGGGSSGSVTYKNTKGTEIEIPLVANDTDVNFGDSSMDSANISSAGMAVGLKGGNMLVADNDYCFSMNSLEDCEGLMLLVTDSSGESRIVELSDVDLANSKMKFKDTTADSTKEVSFTNTSMSTGQSLDIGFTTITAIVNQTAANITQFNMNNVTGQKIIKFTALNAQTDNRMLTSLDGQISLAVTGKDVNVTVYNSTNDGKGVLGAWNISYDTSDDEIQIKNVIGPSMADEEKSSDWQTGIDTSSYGAVFRYDSDAKKDATVVYPEEKVVANVYVAPVSAAVSGGGIAAVVKDSEIGDAKTTKNLIVVGGSAVNKIAADLVKVSYPTYGAAWTAATGVGENMALIKLYSGASEAFSTGQVALLVAGYDAKDTQAAAKALITENKFGVLKTTTASAYSYA
jgi:hypothetical protein